LILIEDLLAGTDCWQVQFLRGGLEINQTSHFFAVQKFWNVPKICVIIRAQKGEVKGEVLFSRVLFMEIPGVHSTATQLAD